MEPSPSSWILGGASGTSFSRSAPTAPLRERELMSVERQILFWGLVLGVVGFLLHLLGAIIAPFAAGIALGYLLDPLVGKMEKLGLNRLGAALIILVVFAATFSLVLIVVAPILGSQLIVFVQKLPGY